MASNHGPARLVQMLILAAVVALFAPITVAETVLGFPETRHHANLGVSVAADEGWIAAGAPGYGVAAVEEGGVAVFRPTEDGWVFERTITATNPEPWSRLGYSVDLSGTVLVAGAPGWRDRGGVLVVDLASPDGSVAELSATDGAAGDRFGSAVAVDDATIAVGAREAGRVYLYTMRGPGLWDLDQVLVGAAPGDGFGASVALDGGRLAVGCDEQVVQGLVSGAVTIFDRSGERWVESQVVLPEAPVEGALFGRSVALHHELLVVGAPSSRSDGGLTGEVFMYSYHPGSAQWSLEQILGAPEATPGSMFGLDVTLEEGRLAVGAPGDRATAVRGGSVWTYRQFGPSWVLTSGFEASRPLRGDHLGRSVALSRGRVLAGMPSDDANGRAAGSVLAFAASDRWRWDKGPRAVASADVKHGGGVVGPDAGRAATASMACSFDDWPSDGLGPEFFNISVKELDPRFPELAGLAEMIRLSGAAGVGAKIHWEYTERARGAFDWGSTDALLESFSDAALDPLMTVRGVPRWASSVPESEHYWSYPPVSLEDWEAWVRALVMRYGSPGRNQVRRWEIWNEPNQDDYFLGTVDEYLELLNAAYFTIKATDPDAEVWAPSVTFHPWSGERAWDFLDRVIEDGYFDVLSIHLYFEGPDEAHAALVEVGRRLNTAGLGEVPIAVTEINTLDIIVDCRGFNRAGQAVHAAELDQLIRCAAAAGASAVYWFKSTDRGMHCGPPWDLDTLRNGIVGDGWVEKSEYHAFRSLVSDVVPAAAEAFERCGGAGRVSRSSDSP